jgi:hypothetical protein
VYRVIPGGVSSAASVSLPAARISPLRHGAFLEQEGEAARRVEVFEDADATLPGSVVKEGAPGHETFTGDAVGPGGEDDRGSGRSAGEERW